jgi:carbon monoxide dehydrogenase subunit G
MHFEGEFRVPGSPDTVMRRFADVERMSRCMPGAVIEGLNDDGSYLGAMVVSFGPKKINFRGRVTHECDATAHTGILTGRGAAEMRAARIGVTVRYSLRADGADSIVTLASDAELGGVLADFARTGGIPVANALMHDFAARMAQEFASEAPLVPEPASPPAPLPVQRLLWEIVKDGLRRFVRWIGFGPRSATTEGKQQ